MSRYTFARVIPFLCWLALPLQVWAQAAAPQTAARQRWVDSVYRSLDTDARIGQLFMVAAYSGGPGYNEAAISRLIADRQIGGLIFMQGGPGRQAALTNRYQAAAQVPLLVAMDAEWGLGMRLDSVLNFPRQMMLGAADDSALVYRVGAAIAGQCRRLGVHIDFAPVVDVNNNPANPVINVRAFGEDKTRVARLGIAYMKGLQENGVMACAKHFPGHGDTDADSHKELPVIRKSRSQLDTLELYPFRALIRAGVRSVMVAHLEIPALEQEPHVPTTLSKNTVTGLLKEKMGFQGIVFTDAMNMQGVTKYFEPGEADLRAFLAGNDMLLFSQDVPVAIKKIKDALQQSQVTERDLEERVKKILAAKYDAGLARWQPVPVAGIVNDLNRLTAPLRKEVAAAAVTLVRDENDILTKLQDQGARIGYVGVNADSARLCRELQQAAGVFPRWLPKGSAAGLADKIINEINTNTATIIAVHGLNIYPANNYGLDSRQMDFLRKVQDRKDVMIVLMGNPYFLKNSCNVRSAVVGYEDDSIAQQAVAAVLLQRTTPSGRLPVTPCSSMPAGTTGVVAMAVPSPERPPAPAAVPGQLQKVYFPEDAGVVNPVALDKLNMYIQRCIVAKAFPGCRILAAKDGKVFYNQAFGYYTYEKDQPVTDTTLYDVASLTKVLSTTLAVMRLYEQGRLTLNKTLGDYFPFLKGTDKGAVTIRQLLLHQAGMKSWIPFYKETLDANGGLRADLYRTAPEQGFGRQVAAGLYLRNDFTDTIWQRIHSQPLENAGRSVYSDLDFYYLAAIVERITKQPLNVYVQEEFYRPLGLHHILYNPLWTTDSAQIAPTEHDLTFRRQQLQGYVHDQGAALLGGVAGHAGLFATAGDVAVIFQMLLNYGTYKGVRYFRKETVTLFTAYGSPLSRRGLGFDKPEADMKNAVVTGNRCSGYTFGHQGFTGTCVWADPATGVVFVFLSNRIYPSAENTRINKLNVRTVAQDYIYESLGIPANANRPAVKQLQLSGRRR